MSAGDGCDEMISHLPLDGFTLEEAMGEELIHVLADGVPLCKDMDYQLPGLCIEADLELNGVKITCLCCIAEYFAAPCVSV